MNQRWSNIYSIKASCATYYSLPNIYFYNNIFIYFVSQFSENPDNQSLSVLTYTPAIDDDGKYLTCRAENPHIEYSAIEDKWSLIVHCK